VPGSHQRGLVSHVPIAEDPAEHTLEAPGDHDDEAAPAPLRLGGASMHQQLTMHKTGPNRSGADRTAWILQFVRPRTLGEHVGAATRRFRPAEPHRL
jgi:ectoine hydroxylase-related dioxygenase (phytanoyl-CoA dioxygenase family)